jgi:hypothetical protein
VFANGELLASNVRFQRATDFVTLEPGEYEIALAPVGQNAAVVSGTFTLEGRPDDPTTPGVDESLTTFTAIAFGTGTDLSLALVPDDLSAINQPRSSRLTIFNAFTGAPTVSLLDFGSTFDENDTRVIIPALEQGALSEPFVLEEGANFATWAFVDDANRILFRLNNPQLFKVERDTTQLVVLMGERLAIDDTLRPVAIPFVTPATPSFGGPHAVGQLLLSRYLLPFELVSILLLVAMIGAVVLTQRVQKPSARRQRGRQVVSRPLTSVLAAQVGKDILKAPTPAAQAAATPADGAGQVAAQEQPQAEEPEPVGD